MNKLIQEIKELPTAGDAQRIVITEVIHDIEVKKPMVNIIFTIGLMWNSSSDKNEAFLARLLELLIDYNHKN
jgi:hypothetical protein